ncbi:MAG: hypothetical protein ACKVRN_15990 [Pyrinomonadaceae bacterium]
MKNLLSTIFLFVCFLSLLGCDVVTSQESFISTPTPAPSPVSVFGDECKVNTKVFSFNGRTDFGECEVRKNAKLFNGKTIRITAGYGFMIHGSYLFSENCELSRSIDESISVGMEKKNRDYLQNLGRLPADITAIGTFSVSEPSNRTDTIYDRTPYHFSIICLEKATARPKK